MPKITKFSLGNGFYFFTSSNLSKKSIFVQIDFSAVILNLEHINYPLGFSISCFNLHQKNGRFLFYSSAQK